MKRIIVAEDDAHHNNYIVKVLSGEGYEVIGALDGKEALQSIHDAIAIDLLITDIGMPEFDGYELINTLGKENYEFPILVQSTKFDRGKIKYSGRVEFIRKAYDVRDELLPKVQQIIGDGNS